MTEWDDLRAIDLKRLKAKMAGNQLIDLRNVYNPEDVIAAGFEWQGIGKPGVAKAKVPSAG